MSYPVAQPTTESTGLVGDLILAKHRLKSGDWDPRPSSSLVILLTSDRWLLRPQSWLGVHDLVVRLSGLPAFITYTAFVWLVAGTVYLVAKSGVEHSIRQLKKHTDVQDPPDDD